MESEHHYHYSAGSYNELPPEVRRLVEQAFESMDAGAATGNERMVATHCKPSSSATPHATRVTQIFAGTVLLIAISCSPTWRRQSAWSVAPFSRAG